MLVVPRSPEEMIVISDGQGGHVGIKVLDVGADGIVRLGVQAPQDWQILRAENMAPRELPAAIRSLRRPRPPIDSTGPAPLGRRIRQRSEKD